jgi:hypothetical protein
MVRIKDLADILEGARKDAENKPTYRSDYYKGVILQMMRSMH